MAYNSTINNTWDVGVSIHRTGNTPLDTTQNHDSKDALDTYAASGATAFVGQQVNVVSSNEVTGCYIIKNQAGDLIELASKSDLSSAVANLGPVFKFKGRADSIDKDNTTLTIGEAYYTPEVDEGETSVTYTIVNLGVYQDLGKVPYYAWGYLDDSSNPVILYYTTPDENGAVSTDGDLYKMKMTEGATPVPYELNVVTFNYKGNDYYKMDSGDVVNKNLTYPVGQTDGIWENLDGDVVYSASVVDSATTITIFQTSTLTGDDAVQLAASLPLERYKAYEFEMVADDDKISLGEKSNTLVTASTSNNGHVYQIGDKEYASNGLTWVELGSPQEDWIVL